MSCSSTSRAVVAVLGVLLIAGACAGAGRRDDVIDELLASGAYDQAQATCFVDTVAAESSLSVLDPEHELTADDVRVLAAARRRCQPFVDTGTPGQFDEAGDLGVDGGVDPAEQEAALAAYAERLASEYLLGTDEARCVADAVVAVLGEVVLSAESVEPGVVADVEIDAVAACVG